MLRSTSILAGLSLLLLAGSAHAQDAQRGGRLAETCKAELAGICATAAGGTGGGMRCLFDNQAKLAAPCAAAVKTAQDRRAAVQASCGADAQKLCVGVEGRGGQLVQCQRGKQAE